MIPAMANGEEKIVRGSPWSGIKFAGRVLKHRDIDRMRPANLIKIMMLALLGLGALVHQGNTRSDPDYFFTIQMASFQHKASALDAVKDLKQKELDVFYRPIQIAGKGIWYRQYINRYTTIQAAQAGITNLRKQGIIADAYVRRLDGRPRVQPGPNQQKPKPHVKGQPQPSATLQVGSNPLQNSELVTGPGADTMQNKGDLLKIRDISLQLSSEKGDIASIRADRYFWPVTQLDHGGGKTRLQVRIRNSGPFHKDLSSHVYGGRYIQAGQVAYDSDRTTLVLSLDLPAAANYHVTQLFNHADNSFRLLFNK